MGRFKLCLICLHTERQSFLKFLKIMDNKNKFSHFTLVLYDKLLFCTDLHFMMQIKRDKFLKYEK